MPFCVRKSPWLTGSLPRNRRRLPEHTRPSNGQWKPCVGRMASGQVFVDVVGKINDEEAMLRLNLLSWFLDCRCVSSLSSSFSVFLGTAPYLGTLEKGEYR